MGPPNLSCALLLKLKDRDTLIEQSYILIRQSVIQVLMENNWLQWSIIEA